ncbi:MAG TPA: MogA/MoaB family molybdenum cofactor biosynthesis protein [Tepidisphaeraceae bacterium]|nr:MogA/MoaB family molybdenum cofactor biosynthesis protein [Tepidisphaeraceae bacterium]
MSYEQHKSAGQAIVARCAVLTLSDTRTAADDISGKRICELLKQAGHAISEYSVLKDDAGPLGESLNRLLVRDDVDLIITTGGTGIARRDQAIGAVERRITSPLPGFGELFRMLSWQQIGSGAMLSRATAGIAKDKIIFALPGSIKAVDLAMERLILPEIGHLIYEIRKG